jgi:hypothetical protein
MARFPASSSEVEFGVNLYLNGNYIGTGFVREDNTRGQNSPLTLQSTLNLKSGDQIWVEISEYSTGGFLYDVSPHYTHFTGFMLEEDIVTSL